jgi:hypothetical protein
MMQDHVILYLTLFVDIDALLYLILINITKRHHL